jgi:hypothetical protein
MMTVNKLSPAATSPRKTIVAMSQEDQIRARLLNRLGIHDSRAAAAAPTTAAQNRRLRILRGMGVGGTIKASPPDGSAVRDPLAFGPTKNLLSEVMRMHQPKRRRHE